MAFGWMVCHVSVRIICFFCDVCVIKRRKILISFQIQEFMRKFTLRGSALMLALTLCVSVFAENAGVETKAIYSYGAMLDGGFSVTPTGVIRSFYDANNRLSRILEADIMLADSEGTPEVEVPGQVIPKLYSVYEYDAEGRLQKVRTRKYGIYSAFDRAWTDFVDAEVYEYNDNGKLVKKTDAAYVTIYTWEGENLVDETAYYVKDSTWSNTIRYTAFVEGEVNKPLSALYSDKWSASNNRIYEYAYDEAGNKVMLNEYKVINAETEEKGILVKGDKGDLYQQQTWAYTDGVLAEEVKGYWNSGKEVVDPSTKITYTVEGDTTTIETFQYFNGQWGRYGGPKKKVSGVLDASMIPTDVAVSPVQGAVNTFDITAQIPENAPSDGWNVYRNGMLLGEAECVDGVLSFQDSLVANGTWDYFVQRADDNISGVVTKVVNTKLAPVQGVCMLKNSLSDVGDYEMIFSWVTPNTTLDILGYNVYLDIPSYETNPAPENGKVLIPDALKRDTLVWPAGETKKEHNIYVEVVYPIGKVRSQAIPVRLQEQEQQLYTKAVMTMGDAMGQASDDNFTKAEVYYYGDANKLVRKMIYGKLLGDDESDPDQFYKGGDWIPMTYTAYDYNEKGQLVHTRERQYGVFSGYNKAWNEFVETGSFGYDESGRLAEDTVTNRVYHYKYDGDNIIQETYANSRDIIIHQKYYSQFVPGLVNCPQYAFCNSPGGVTTSSNRIYEYTYDGKGNMLTCRAYKYLAGSEVKNDDGHVVSAEKGTPDYEEMWTYDNGILVKYEKNVWKTAKNAYEGKTRIEYELTSMGTKAVTWSYSVGIWAKGGTPQVTWDVPFDGVAASELAIEEVAGEVNTVKLTAKKPADALATTVWNVFRNGCKIGQATSKGRHNLEFIDKEVPNGTWDYFIQAADSHGPVGVNVSNVVEKKIYTELPPVTDIRIISNGYNAVKDYELVLEWDAPKTDLPVKGYNMFVDVKEITKNPSPVNGFHPFNETTYTYTAANDVNPDKTFIVEAVYNIGKVKSEALAVRLQGESGIEDVTVDNNLVLAGRTLLITGEYVSLEIYSASGALVGYYRGVSQIDLSAQASGVYMIRLNTAAGVLTGKFAVK